MDAAARVKATFEPGTTGFDRRDYVIKNFVDGILVEDSLIAVGKQVFLEAFQLKTKLVGDVSQDQLGEIGQAGLGADAGKLGGFHADLVVAIGIDVFEGLNRGGLPAADMILSAFV